MKTLVVYYSQTGQTRSIAESVTSELMKKGEVHFEELKPVQPYPFPWQNGSFFEVFPESVQEIPCELEPFGFNPEDDYDLVVLAYPVWYLSPSIPMSSFLQSPEAKKVMNGKAVITMLGVRNMWAMAQERVKHRIREAGGKLVGHIVLEDPYPNLVSVITIVRWMIKGEREGHGLYKKIFPPAGVTEEAIQKASIFGEIISKAFDEDHLEGLQAQLMSEGAIKPKPVLLSVEKRGKMMFGFWSKFVLKKGKYNDPARKGRLKAFKYYLFTVIYLVSPPGSLVIGLFHTLTPGRTKKIKKYYTGVNLKEK